MMSTREIVRYIRRWYRSDVLTSIKIFLMKEEVLKKFNKIEIPPILYFEGTNICNALCIFCYYPKIKDELPKKTMSIDLFKEIIFDYESIGGSKVALTPTVGDPLVDKLFSERVRVIDQSNISRMHFYTNLIDFRISHVEALENVQDTIIDVNVSISGFNRDKYNEYMGVDKFERVVRNLKRLSKIHNSNITRKITLRDYGGSNVEKKNFTLLLQNLNLDFSINTEYDSWGGLLESVFEKHTELKRQKMELRKGPCQISYTKPLITVDGELKLCDCRDVHNELVVGNLSENTFSELWNGDNIKKIRNTMFSKENMPEICKKCEMYTSIYNPDSKQILVRNLR